MSITLKGLVSEDTANYKKASMFLCFPRCSFKCEKDSGCKCCQNKELYNAQDIVINIDEIVEQYISNSITSAIVLGGMEPFDSWFDMYCLVARLREKTDDDIVIYTGYYEEEISSRISILKHFNNIIVKFGRFIPNDKSVYDDTLGVYLASGNQYAKRIS